MIKTKMKSLLAAGIDPTPSEGQLAFIPNFTEGKAKVAAKREYNHRNAARARKRSKSIVAVLQERDSSLTKRTIGLTRSNNVLTTQIGVLQTENLELAARRSLEEEQARSVSS
jgi:hypothetical protein